MTDNTLCVVSIKTLTNTPLNTTLAESNGVEPPEGEKVAVKDALDTRKASIPWITANNTYSHSLNSPIAKSNMVNTPTKDFKSTPEKEAGVVGKFNNFSPLPNQSQMLIFALSHIAAPIASYNNSHPYKLYPVPLPLRATMTRAEISNKHITNQAKLTDDIERASTTAGEDIDLESSITPNNWEEEQDLLNTTLTSISTLAALGYDITSLGNGLTNNPDQVKAGASSSTPRKLPTPHHTNRPDSDTASVGSDMSRVRRDLKRAMTLQDMRIKERLDAVLQRRQRRDSKLSEMRGTSDTQPEHPADEHADRAAPPETNPAAVPETPAALPPTPQPVTQPGELVNQNDAPMLETDGQTPAPEATPNANDGEKFASAAKVEGLNYGETQQPKRRARGKGKKGKKQPDSADNPNTQDNGGEGEQRSGLTADQVFERPDPTATITVTRQGFEGDAHNVAARSLFVITPVFDVLSLRPVPDGARIEVADRTAIDSVRRAMGSQGWTVTLEDIWSRFHFLAPRQLAGLGPDSTIGQGLDPTTIVRTLALRNSALWGLPADSVRYAGSNWETAPEEGQGSSGATRRRLRIWVDVSPECEEYLARHGFFMTTLAGAVRLRRAPRRPRSGRT